METLITGRITFSPIQTDDPTLPNEVRLSAKASAADPVPPVSPRKQWRRLSSTMSSNRSKAVKPHYDVRGHRHGLDCFRTSGGYLSALELDRPLSERIEAVYVTAYSTGYRNGYLDAEQGKVSELKGK